jgi:DNA-binding response OmpR family regulator
MSHAKKLILAIDDDPDIRAALRVLLEAAGFSVGEAANGEEGLKIAERIQPDAVIVDLMMERVDAGSTVAAALKEDNFSGPVFMLSSAGDAVQYNIDAGRLGLAGIFQKPVQPEVLVKTLNLELHDKEA